MKPAWSWQFDPDSLRPLRPLEHPVPLTKAWAWGSASGKGVRVAVVDSGIDVHHPAVAGAVKGGVALHHDPTASGQVRMVEGLHGDVAGHGTACSGIIRQVAPDVELYSVRVLGGNLRTRGLVFAQGLRWAIDNGMHVVNLSLSTSKSEYFSIFHELADKAYFLNVMLVSAVSNAAGPSYPSLYPSVFSVAAHDKRDPFGFDYNPSPPIEFGAPGIDVDVAWMNGATIRTSGNSFAAAHITGLIARILGKHPGLTPFQIEDDSLLARRQRISRDQAVKA